MDENENRCKRQVRRVYIAGPMRGKPGFNFTAFDEAAKQLRQCGYTVVSPADLDRENGFFGTLAECETVTERFVAGCIRRDLEAMLDCDHVVVLEGWQHSVGARLEVDVALAAGISVGNMSGETLTAMHRQGSTMAEVARIMDVVFAECRHLRACGQAEYAHDEDNAFRNFETIGERAAVSREMVLSVYCQKHIDGIWAWVHGHRSQRENVRGRINDVIVYLCLLRAMIDQDDRDGRALAVDQPIGEAFFQSVAETMPEVP